MFKSLLLAATLLSFAAHAQDAEKPDIDISIGTWVIQYLPLPVAVANGYLRAEGLNVSVTNFQADGSRALQALVVGSNDMVVGFYDHTIQMQVQNKEVRVVIMLNQLPGGAFVIRHDLASTVKSLADLKGMKIGITALGYSSEFQT